MHRICVVLVDGVGDRAYRQLGGRTANEAAATPQLDRLCARGSCGLLWPLGPGRAPSTEAAHWAMLGYLPEEFPGRAVLEALGAGKAAESGDVLAYAALRPAERRGAELWLTGRPGAGDEDEARELVASVERIELDGLGFSLDYLGGGESILRVSGGADDRVTDTDAFFRERDPVLGPQPLVPDAAATAGAVERWSVVVHERLSAHSLNRAREGRGEAPLNVVTLKWWGRPRDAPSFESRHGLAGGLVIGSSPVLAGLARTIGLAYEEPEPEAGTTRDLEARLALAARALDAGSELVLVHTKASDEAGHTKQPHAKVYAIQAVDTALARLAEPPFSDAIVCVTGDHATPASPEVIHSGDPVPLALAGPGVRADRVERWGEIHCRDGILGHLRGADLMPVLLNAADRPLYAGSRPTPVGGATGHPSNPPPLRIEP